MSKRDNQVRFCIDKLDCAFEIRYRNGEPFSRDCWIRRARENFDNIPKIGPAGMPPDAPRTVALPLNASDIHAVFPDGTSSDIRDVVAEIQFRTDRRLLQGDIIKIIDAVRREALVEAAVYRVNAVGFDGHVVVRRTGEATSVLQVLSDKPVVQEMAFKVLLEKDGSTEYSEQPKHQEDNDKDAVGRLTEMMASI